MLSRPRAPHRATERCWVPPWHPRRRGIPPRRHGGAGELCPPGEGTVPRQIQQGEMLGGSLGLIKFWGFFGLKVVNGWAGHAGDLPRD